MISYKIKSAKGFTLIELLVVIAIIGILSSVVLSSLNTARAKGADAAVKANLKGIVAQGAIVYDNTGSYDTVCGDVNVVEAVAAAGTAGGGAGECQDAATEWAAEAPLKGQNQAGPATGQDYWCVDNTGIAKFEDLPLGAGTVCL
jgi:prepilin-type N-terminal cleavage/methylation domain-containing protein